MVNISLPLSRWFFGKISRREAEKLLLLGDYPKGTFLIRNSEQTAGRSIISWLRFEFITNHSFLSSLFVQVLTRFPYVTTSPRKATMLSITKLRR